MSTGKRRRHEGIVERHGRHCMSREGGACSCGDRLAYQAWAWDPGTRRKVRRTFPTQAAARAWRADAQVAIRRQELRAGPVPTLEAAARALLAGMEDGSTGPAVGASSSRPRSTATARR
jgi:hypothetical protein